MPTMTLEEVVRYIRRTLAVVQPVMIQGDLYLPTEVISRVLDVIESEVKRNE